RRSRGSISSPVASQVTRPNSFRSLSPSDRFPAHSAKIICRFIESCRVTNDGHMEHLLQTGSSKSLHDF
ncbi:hypothetical protein L9F63_011078, partial [Diploptera punctata]